MDKCTVSAKRPLISVIVPVYNAEEYVRACLDSLCSQTLDRIEIICIDDGSTDRSLQVVEGCKKHDGRISVVSQPNAGAAAARNKGLELASGEFVFFIDSDDYVPADTAFERLYNAAVSNNVRIAGGSMCFDRFGEMDYTSMHDNDMDLFKNEEVLDYADYQYDYDFTRFIYSLDMLRREQISFPLLRQFEDPVFHVKAMLAARRFAAIPDFVYVYRRFGREEGHDPTWEEDAAYDRLVGMMEVLQLSRDHNLSKLHNYVVEQLEKEAGGIYLKLTESPRIMRALYRFNSMIDSSMIAKERDDFSGTDYVLGNLNVICDGYRKYKMMRDTPVAKGLAGISHLIRGGKEH